MFKHLAVVCLAVASTACAVKPGEYRIYRLASQEVAGVCDPAVEPDPDYTVTDNFFGATLAAVFASDKDTFFLEYGSEVIAGTRDGSEYTFNGNRDETQQYRADEDGVSRDFSVRRVYDITIKVDLKGKGLTGTAVVTQSTECTGPTMDCQLVGAFVSTCTFTSDVFGSEVDDVDIEYVIGGGGVGDAGLDG